jgi:tRNA pseudouridine55 synthase
MKPRELTIYSIELTRPLVETFPHFHISVDCGKGTYIRSLVRDIARELGSKAHLTALRRTRQGDFALEDCMSPELMGNAKHIIGLLEDASDQVHLEADMAEDGEDKKA